MKLLVYILFIPVLSLFGCSINFSNEPKPIERCFLQKFKDIKAITRTIISSDSLRYYHIKAFKFNDSSNFNFGWLIFRIIVSKDSLTAANSFNEWKRRLKNNVGETQELYKAPQYHILQSNYIYVIESGCFISETIDSIAKLFVSCDTKLNSSKTNLAKVKCGGILIE